MLGTEIEAERKQIRAVLTFHSQFRGEGHSNADTKDEEPCTRILIEFVFEYSVVETTWKAVRKK